MRLKPHCMVTAQTFGQRTRESEIVVNLTEQKHAAGGGEKAARAIGAIPFGRPGAPRTVTPKTT